MNKSKIILTLAITTLVGCGSSQSYKTPQVSHSSQSVIKHSLDKDIKWSGIIIQTVNNKDNTCFQMIEAKIYKNKPKYKIINMDSRFIACKDGEFSHKDYDKQLVTVTGDIVAFEKLESSNMEFPVINAHSIVILRTPNKRKNKKGQRDFQTYKPYREIYDD